MGVPTIESRVTSLEQTYNLIQERIAALENQTNKDYRYSSICIGLTTTHNEESFEAFCDDVATAIGSYNLSVSSIDKTKSAGIASLLLNTTARLFLFVTHFEQAANEWRLAVLESRVSEIRQKLFLFSNHLYGECKRMDFLFQRTALGKLESLEISNSNEALNRISDLFCVINILLGIKVPPKIDHQYDMNFCPTPFHQP